MSTLARRLVGLARQRCPRCQEGPIYAGFVRMRTHCPACGVRYGREEGYFTGAMYVSYILAFVLVVPLWLVLLFTWQPIWLVVGAPSVLLILATPLIYRYSRAAWMYFDRAFDPDQAG